MAKESSSVAKKAHKLNADKLSKTAASGSSRAVHDNARLNEENQRLRKEIEQRTAELAIINSVQAGLASQLDAQAIYDLVGDKIRGLFNAHSIVIVTFDPVARTRQVKYNFEKGQRYYNSELYPYNKLTKYLVATKQPLVINENAESRVDEFEMFVNPGTDRPKSMVFVPLLAGDEVKGHISLQNVEQENAFSESDVSLLSTFAASMSITIENVRLFDETQRLLNETEQRATELAIINSVQAGLASKLDMQAIYDLVGDKIREFFNAQTIVIVTLDLTTRTRQVKYYFDNGERVYYHEVFPFNKLTEHLIATKRMLVINQNADAIIAEFEMVVLAGERMKSGVFVPLLADNEVRGLITLQNAEQENAFSTSDINVLSALASSIRFALENARLFDETQRLLKITEDRAAELVVINSIQQGLAAELNFQAIVDLVGDKLREVLKTDEIGIRWYEAQTNLIHYLYDYEHGQHLNIPPAPPPAGGVWFKIAETRQPFIRNSVAERQALGITNVPGTDSSKSGVAVPIIGSDRVVGSIVIEDYEKEYAFGEAEVRLLTTVAASMGVALENARLFEQTQHLLKVTEQRAAELAIINSVQAGLASKLDMQAIYDLVGDKIRDLFNAQIVFILTFDPVTRTREIKYNFDKGARFYSSELLPYNKLAEHLIGTKETLVINQDAEAKVAEFEMNITPGTEISKSAIFVPIMAGEEVKGLISLQNVEQENAFSESDVNLLSTFASAMSVALENLRLFDEAQRLLRETEQRAAELAIINSVQAGLASKLDMQAIYDLVGDKIRDLFNAQSVLIMTFDDAARTRHVKYGFEKGQRFYTPIPIPYNKLTEHLIATKKTLVINQNTEARRAEFDIVVLAETERFKSAVFVPLLAGDEVKGLISLQSMVRENAFSESDVNLLSTFASSMSVALENARLYEEQLLMTGELKRVDHMKSQFLSSMSHELRTPLNAIINFVEMIARGMIGPVNQEQEELLDQTLNSSKHLLHLINDVLDISKIQAGRLTLFIEDQVSLQEEVEAVLNIMGGLMQEKELHLIKDIDPNLPTIACDRRRVRQILFNLLSNAIKFTEPGLTITLSAKNHGREVLFGVMDMGPGIPAAKQELIFEPFVQAGDEEHQQEGTGLGLPISRSLVRAHGGELWVESQPGEGAAFFFTLSTDLQVNH
jgi:K+-sensing histidine kinase KdpD